MNQNTHRWYAVAAGLLVLVGVVAWYFMSHNKALAPSSNNSTATTSVATTTGQAGPQVTGIADNSTIPKPDLNRPYTPLSTLPQSVQDNDKQLVATAIAQLKFNPGMIAYWLQLAGLRKGANDFAGAAEIWVYCTKRWPTDPISFNNLGDLYAYYLKDSTKAVFYWTEATKVDPKNPHTFVNLATYQDINLQNKAAAQATLQAGLAANPGNPDIQYALDHLQ